MITIHALRELENMETKTEVSKQIPLPSWIWFAAHFSKQKGRGGGSYPYNNNSLIIIMYYQ
jgi:hypothetical protein